MSLARSFEIFISLFVGVAVTDTMLSARPYVVSLYFVVFDVYSMVAVVEGILLVSLYHALPMTVVLCSTLK